MSKKMFYTGFIVDVEETATKLSRVPFMRCKLHNGAFVSFLNDPEQCNSLIIQTYEKEYNLPREGVFEQRVKNLMLCKAPLLICFRMREDYQECLIASHYVVKYGDMS